MEQELAFCKSDSQLGRGVQVIVDRMARNDATMMEANLSGELSGLSGEFSSLSGERASAARLSSPIAHISSPLPGGRGSSKGSIFDNYSSS